MKGDPVAVGGAITALIEYVVEIEAAHRKAFENFSRKVLPLVRGETAPKPRPAKRAAKTK